MRFFRVTLPRKYLSEENSDELIQTACSIKVCFVFDRIRDSFLSLSYQINKKKFKRYEEKYFLQRADEEEKETPLQRLEVCLRNEKYFGIFFILE